MSKALEGESPGKKELVKALMCAHTFLAYPWMNLGSSSHVKNMNGMQINLC